MVVITIIGLLSSLAYPVYVNYWLQVKRVEGRLALLTLSARLEEYAMTSENGYLGGTLEKLGVDEQTEHKWYKLHIELLEQGYYTLSARPMFKDSACTELSCNTHNQYTYKGNGSYHDCWGGY